MAARLTKALSNLMNLWSALLMPESMSSADGISPMGRHQAFDGHLGGAVNTCKSEVG